MSAFPAPDRAAAGKLRALRRYGPAAVAAGRALAGAIAEEVGRPQATRIEAAIAVKRIEGVKGDLDALAVQLRAEGELGELAAIESIGQPRYVELDRAHLSERPKAPAPHCRRTTVCYQGGRRISEPLAGKIKKAKVGQGKRQSFMGRVQPLLIPGPSGLESWPVQMALVPIDAVTASHQADFSESPGYPARLQERDYERNEGERQKVQLASSPGAWRPELVLTDTVTMGEGPPVIDRDKGWVLGGNSRAIAIKRLIATKKGRKVYQEALRQALDDQAHAWGLERLSTRRDLSRMMIVRLLASDEYDPETVSRRLNRGFTQVTSVSADAVSCGRELPPQVIDLIADGINQGHTLSIALERAASPIAQALTIAGVITPQTRSDWLKTRGGTYQRKLSPRGIARLRLCLLGALVDDAETLELLPPSALDLLGRIAPLALAAGRKNPDHSPVDALRKASAELVRVLESPAAEISNIYAMGSLFGDAEAGALSAELIADPVAVALVPWLYHGRMKPAGAARSVSAWAAKVPKPQTGGLFGLDALDEIDPSELIVEELNLQSAPSIERAGGARGYLARPETWKLGGAQHISTTPQAPQAKGIFARPEVQRAVEAEAETTRRKGAQAVISKARTIVNLARQAEVLDPGLKAQADTLEQDARALRERRYGSGDTLSFHALGDLGVRVEHGTSQLRATIAALMPESDPELMAEAERWAQAAEILAGPTGMGRWGKVRTALREGRLALANAAKRKAPTLAIRLDISTLIHEVKGAEPARSRAWHEDLGPGDEGWRSQLDDLDAARGADYRADIPPHLALDAFEGLTHTPERRAKQATEEYQQHLTSVRESFEEAAGDDPGRQRQAADLFDEYREGRRKRVVAWLAAMSRTMSTHVTGRSGFNVSRNRKRQDVEQKRLDELVDWSKKKARKALRSLDPGQATAVDVSTSDRPAFYATKLEGMEAERTTMKEANKIIRKRSLTDDAKVAALGVLGIAAPIARSLMAPDYGRPGYTYQLTNLTSRINATKKKIVGAEMAAEEIVGETRETRFDRLGLVVIEDPEDERLRIVFDEKPDSEARSVMKGGGWRWSRRHGAWQRKLNERAYGHLDQLTGITREQLDAQLPDPVTQLPPEPDEPEDDRRPSPEQKEAGGPCLYWNEITFSQRKKGAIMVTVPQPPTPDWLRAAKSLKKGRDGARLAGTEKAPWSDELIYQFDIDTRPSKEAAARANVERIVMETFGHTGTRVAVVDRAVVLDGWKSPDLWLMGRLIARRTKDGHVELGPCVEYGPGSERLPEGRGRALSSKKMPKVAFSVYGVPTAIAYPPFAEGYQIWRRE